MRSHGLGQLFDDKPFTICQQTCCKLIGMQNLLFTGLLQVVTSLQMTSSNKLDFNRLACYDLMKLISLFQLVDKLQQTGKIDN